MRETQATLEPLGKQLADLAADVLPKAAKGISDLAEWFSKLPGPVKDFVAISAGLTIVITAIGAIGVLSFAFGALSLSLWPVLGIILGLSAVIAGVIWAVKTGEK